LWFSNRCSNKNHPPAHMREPSTPTSPSSDADNLLLLRAAPPANTVRLPNAQDNRCCFLPRVQQEPSVPTPRETYHRICAFRALLSPLPHQVRDALETPSCPKPSPRTHLHPRFSLAQTTHATLRDDDNYFGAHAVSYQPPITQLPIEWRSHELPHRHRVLIRHRLNPLGHFRHGGSRCEREVPSPLNQLQVLLPIAARELLCRRRR